MDKEATLEINDAARGITAKIGVIAAYFSPSAQWQIAASGPLRSHRSRTFPI
jgi:hypothetical protein